MARSGLGQVADDGELVLEPEGIVPAGFRLVGGVRDGALELGFGVVSDGQSGLSWVVPLVVDEEGDERAVRGELEQSGRAGLSEPYTELAEPFAHGPGADRAAGLAAREEPGRVGLGEDRLAATS